MLMWWFAAELWRTLITRITLALQTTKVHGKTLRRSIKLPLIQGDEPGSSVLGVRNTKDIRRVEQFRWQLAENKPEETRKRHVIEIRKKEVLGAFFLPGWITIRLSQLGLLYITRHYRPPQFGWLKQQTFTFHSPGIWKSEIRYQKIQCLLRTCFLICRQLSFHWILTWPREKFLLCFLEGH